MRKYDENPMSSMTLELVREPLDDVVGQRRRPSARSAPSQREVAQVGGVVGEALGQREVGQLRLAELDLDVGPLGDPQRVVARLGQLAEQVAHLGGRLQVVLVAVELEPLRVAHQRAGLHAQQRVVGLGVVAVRVVAVVGGEQRRADAAGRSRSACGLVRALRRRGRGPAARRRGCRARRCPGAGRPSRARPRRRPAAAPAARGRRGSRWWR